MPTLERSGDVHVLDLGADANRVNPDWIAGVSVALDEIVATPTPRALVTTAAGDFFSMGFDLDWMAANPGGVGQVVSDMHQLVARMLELPLPSVAAIPGHAIAGGALFSLAHDYRVMRHDHGYFCLPEIDVRIAISPGLIDLVKARLAPQVAHEAMTSGRRYTGSEAADAGIVDELASEGEVLPKALEIAEGLKDKDPDTYGAMKSRLYAETLRSLRDAEANRADVAKFEFAMTALGIRNR